MFIWHCLLNIFSVQVKSGACCIKGHCGRVQNKIKGNLALTLTLTLKLLLPSIVFLCLYHDFYGLFTVYLLYEEIMSVRLCIPFYSEHIVSDNFYYMNGCENSASTLFFDFTNFNIFWALKLSMVSAPPALPHFPDKRVKNLKIFEPSSRSSLSKIQTLHTNPLPVIFIFLNPPLPLQQKM